MRASSEAAARHCARIALDDSRYPDPVRRCLADRAPSAITACGNLTILTRQKLALFCSARCPGNLILQTYDLIRQLRDAGATVIGGFHSPMEKECLGLLLRGSQPVVICLARGLDGLRFPSEWEGPLKDGHLLVLSAFARTHRRVTAHLAAFRNEFVAALADEVLVTHAAPGSKTERLCRQVRAWGKPLLTLDSSANANLVALGASVME